MIVPLAGRSCQAARRLAIPGATFNTPACQSPGGDRFVNAAAKAIVKKPVAAYVEKVYEVGDFSAIGSI